MSPADRQDPPPLTLARTVENEERLDPVVAALEPVAQRIVESPAGPVLRGRPMGHALHPALTDVPLGCWISAFVLDLVGGSRARKASQRLIGVGLLAVPATAASGAADWSTIEDQGMRRAGAAHAAGNTVVALAFFRSWRARRRGRHLRGVLWSLAGLALGGLTAYLGGHLAFGPSSTEQGEPAADAPATRQRTLRAESAPRPELAQSSAPGLDAPDADGIDLVEAGRLLEMPPEQVLVLVEQGLLTPHGEGAGVRFSESEVRAVRLTGG